MWCLCHKLCDFRVCYDAVGMMEHLFAPLTLLHILAFHPVVFVVFFVLDVWVEITNNLMRVLLCMELDFYNVLIMTQYS